MLLICIHYLDLFLHFLDISNPLYISSHMSESSEPFVGYADGASHSTKYILYSVVHFRSERRVSEFSRDLYW